MERDQIEKKRKFNVYNINTEKRQPKVPIKYRFPVDYNDCFETPMIAYQDISIVIDLMAKSLGKSRNSIILYDPYYCQGNTIKYLNQLGFPNVINRNSDFYDDIKKNEIPGKFSFAVDQFFFAYLGPISFLQLTEYDIMITNPPFSGEHKAKLLKYIGGINKPFAILLPLYTATKAYWRAFVDFTSSISPLKSSLIEFPSGSPSQRDVQSHNKDKSSYNKKSNKISNVSNISDKTNEKVKPVADVVTYITYILPPDNYEYTHPEGTGKDQPPFYSSWFVGTGPCCDPTVRVNLNPARYSQLFHDPYIIWEVRAK